ncbi:MAG: LacI family transcriptional regulator [Actinobacteria bacterium]|nr:LacI family transcriptional regulator [Actinomycetota bacterium]
MPALYGRWSGHRKRQALHVGKEMRSGRTDRKTDNIRPTIHDVARIAGVSTASVSRVLSGRGNVSSTVEERVRHAAELTGYKPHLVARSLVKRRTWLLGIIVPDISNPFFPELVKAIQVRAEQEGYGTLLSQVIGDTSFPHQLELLGAGRVDGIITVGLSVGQLDTGKLAGAAPSLPGSVALVCLDRDSALPGSTLIAVDHRLCARMVVSHLVSHGHREILYIDGPDGLELSTQRRLGYEDVMRGVNNGSGGLPVLRGDLSEASGYRVISESLVRGLSFTAVFAANDLMAIGAMSALRNAGLVVPEDVSVAGFDDITIAAYVSPGLTTIHQPVDLMGAVAAEVAIAEVEGRYRRSSAGSRSRSVAGGAESTTSEQSARAPVSMAGNASKGAGRSDAMYRDRRLGRLPPVESGGDLSSSQLQSILSRGLAYESWLDGRTVITFGGSLVVRGSTSAVNTRRALSRTAGVVPGVVSSDQGTRRGRRTEMRPVAGVVD